MTDEKFFETFRQRAEDGLRLWESPSVAVGVVKDGKVVLCEGYGLRDTAGKLPATGETLYQIGSCAGVDPGGPGQAGLGHTHHPLCAQYPLL